MVRWLIQKKNVVLFEHQGGQGNAALFTAGEGLDLLEDIVSGKQKHSEGAPNIGLLHGGEAVPYLIQYGFIRMERTLMLIIITKIYIGAEFDFSAVWQFFARKNPDKGGLADAVWTDDGNALAGADMERKVLE